MLGSMRTLSSILLRAGLPVLTWIALAPSGFT